ncbi:hypothetical protein NC652_016765 [Populus alba x Populus x berolinensis]|nr:hypothetical protein NC652_016765 [Populus alba x Populus x berolinensis]
MGSSRLLRSLVYNLIPAVLMRKKKKAFEKWVEKMHSSSNERSESTNDDGSTKSYANMDDLHSYDNSLGSRKNNPSPELSLLDGMLLDLSLWNSSPIKNPQSKKAASFAVASPIFLATSSPWRLLPKSSRNRSIYSSTLKEGNLIC